MARITFHIEELVLTGFSPGEHGRIRDALESALTESLTHGALKVRASGGRTIETLEPLHFENTARHNARTLGSRVARVLVAGIGDVLGSRHREAR